MSEILSEEIERVVKIKRKVTGIKCDICGKIIPVNKGIDISKYFAVRTGHNDWGNDSYESVKNYDICPDCIIKFTTEYLQTTTGTEYLEVQTTYATDYNRYEVESEEE